MATKQFSVVPKTKDKLKKKGLGGQLKNKRKIKLDRKYSSNKVLRYESTTKGRNWMKNVVDYINTEIVNVDIKRKIIFDLKRNFFKYVKNNTKGDYISFLENKYKPSKRVAYDNLCQVGKRIKDNKTPTIHAIQYEVVGSGNPNLYCINGSKVLESKIDKINSLNSFELIITIIGENHE